MIYHQYLVADSNNNESPDVKRWINFEKGVIMIIICCLL